MRQGRGAMVLLTPFFAFLGLGFGVGMSFAQTERHLVDQVEISRKEMGHTSDAVGGAVGHRGPDSVEIIRDNATNKRGEIMEVEQVDHRSPEAELLPVAGPDERILWELLNHHQLTQLRQRIASWRERYPTWQPPADLLRYLAEQEQAGRRKQQEDQRREQHHTLAAAFRSGNVQQTIAASYASRGNFTCDRIGNIKAILPLYAFTHNQRDVLGVVQTALTAPSCADSTTRLYLIESAMDYLDVDTFDALLDHSMPLFKDKIMQGRLLELQYRHHVPYLAEVLAEGVEPSNGYRLIDKLAARIEARHDAPMALPVAWFFAKENRLDLAGRWFRHVTQWTSSDSSLHGEAIYGQALVLHKQGEVDRALELAGAHLDAYPKIRPLYDEILLEKAHALFREGQFAAVLSLVDESQPPVAGLAPLVGKIYLEQAWQAYRRGDYDQSLSLVGKVPHSPESRVEVETLLAWVDFSRKDYQRAGERFAALKQENPSDEFDQALLVCRQALAKATGGESELDTTIALYYRKQFLAFYDTSQADAVRAQTAAFAAPSALFSEAPQSLLANIDSPQVEGDILYRNRHGESGTSSLQAVAWPVVEGSYVQARNNLFSFVGQRLQLKGGNLDPWLTPAGSSGVFRADGDRSLAQSVETAATELQIYRLTYRRDGWWGPFAAIGLAPVNGIVDPALVFQLGVRQQIEAGSWQFGLSSEPVMDSILSFSGMKDPYSDRKWGRVMHRSGEGNVLYSLTDDWTFFGRAEGGVLRGEGVDDNWMVGLAGNLGYNLRFPGFDYFAVGPGVRYEHYDQNRSHFTLGHGGYFSPDRYRNLGVEASFLTDEGRPFIAKGHVAVGYQTIENSEAELFPGQPSTVNPVILQADNTWLASYAADRSQGAAYDFEVIGSWLFAPRWQLKGGVAYRKTNGYEDVYFGLGLSFSLRPRAAAFSHDLPRQMFEVFY